MATELMSEGFVGVERGAGALERHLADGHAVLVHAVHGDVGREQQPEAVGQRGIVQPVGVEPEVVRVEHGHGGRSVAGVNPQDQAGVVHPVEVPAQQLLAVAGAKGHRRAAMARTPDRLANRRQVLLDRRDDPRREEIGEERPAETALGIVHVDAARGRSRRGGSRRSSPARTSWYWARARSDHIVRTWSFTAMPSTIVPTTSTTAKASAVRFTIRQNRRGRVGGAVSVAGASLMGPAWRLENSRGAEDLQRHAADEVFDRLAVVEHVRRHQVRFQRVDASSTSRR